MKNLCAQISCRTRASGNFFFFRVGHHEDTGLIYYFQMQKIIYVSEVDFRPHPQTTFIFKKSSGVCEASGLSALQVGFLHGSSSCCVQQMLNYSGCIAPVLEG